MYYNLDMTKFQQIIAGLIIAGVFSIFKYYSKVTAQIITEGVSHLARRTPYPPRFHSA